MTTQLQFVIPTLLGLEGLVADELRRLGMAGVAAENGRVFCSGGPADIPRLNPPGGAVPGQRIYH